MISGPTVISEPARRPKFKIGERVAFTDRMIFACRDLFTSFRPREITGIAIMYYEDGGCIYTYSLRGESAAFGEAALCRCATDLLLEKFGYPTHNLRGGTDGADNSAAPPEGAEGQGLHR